MTEKHWKHGAPSRYHPRNKMNYWIIKLPGARLMDEPGPDLRKETVKGKLCIKAVPEVMGENNQCWFWTVQPNVVNFCVWWFEMVSWSLPSLSLFAIVCITSKSVQLTKTRTGHLCSTLFSMSRSSCRVTFPAKILQTARFCVIQCRSSPLVTNHCELK